MSRKSRLFLGAACVAMAVALSSRLFAGLVAPDLADFSIGLAAALMVGVLVTSKGRRAPQT